jgi:glycosyltransferase involved in cell wall biosynthesis
MIKKNVDIILPVYNSRKYILNTINSIIKQSYKFWNLIIIDDFSTDGTYALLKDLKKKYSNNSNKIFLYQNIRNKGQAFARNLGLKKSKSEFVAFIDSDDIWERDKLKYQLQFMLSNKYNFTYTDYKTVKNGKRKIIKVSK